MLTLRLKRVRWEEGTFGTPNLLSRCCLGTGRESCFKVFAKRVLSKQQLDKALCVWDASFRDNRTGSLLQYSAFKCLAVSAPRT